MKIVRLVSQLAFACTAMCAATAASAATTLFFQMNPNLSAGPRQAFIFGAANSTGTVSGAGGAFNQAFNLGAQGFSVVDVPVGFELSNNVVQNLGFRIDSSANLSGYFLSRTPFTTDMTYLIDGSKLGTDYFVSTYRNIFEDQVSVQATVDNTVVTITPKGGAAFDISLDAGETYMHTNGSVDQTGARVQSTAPVAVFSGNRCTNIPTGNTACDHIVEQMPSVDSLSTSYLVAQTPRTGALGNVVRVVATADGTTVQVDGTTVATLDAGQFYEGRVAGGKQITADKKVLVAEYLIGQTQAGDNTDPAMTIVPGTDQWLKSYVFASPSGTANFPTDFITTIIRTADIGTLFVDGVLANSGLFTAIGSTGYSFGSIDVSTQTGPYSITAASEFQLLLTGFDNFDSYFTYGGAAFSPGASPPPPNGAVPEPATWAMLILGFGMVGAALRAARKQRPVLNYV